MGLELCKTKTQLERKYICNIEMYVSRHRNKFIKSGQIPSRKRPPIIDYQNEIVEMYVRREGVEEGIENRRGRRFITWAFDKRLGANQTPSIMTKLRQNINRAFYIRYNFAYVLVNRKTGLRIVFYKQQKGSPWINNFAEAERWMNEQENERLNLDNIERPNTKWAFVKFSNIEIKAALNNQPMLGTGPLPDWLCNLAHGLQMVSLNTFRDNLRVWRCIAVYQGARLDRCNQKAKELAKGFFKSNIVPRTSLDEHDKVEMYMNKRKQLREWIGIRVYEPERQENGEIYWHLRKNPSDKLKNIITTGIYEGHAFLIRDINKLAKTYVCDNCQAHFTQACSLQRHTKTCAQGRTIINCSNENVKAPQTVYERTFYKEIQASPLATNWLEKTSKRLGIHIHHALCGHGGERWILGALVDGYAEKPEIIFQYHGCWWHGCRRCFADRNTKMSHGITREELYLATEARTKKLREARYRVIEKLEMRRPKNTRKNPTKADKNLLACHFLLPRVIS